MEKLNFQCRIWNSERQAYGSTFVICDLHLEQLRHSLAENFAPCWIEQMSRIKPPCEDFSLDMTLSFQIPAKPNVSLHFHLELGIITVATDKFLAAVYVKGELIWKEGDGDLGTVPVDKEILEWFKAKGENYLAQINAVLRTYIEIQTRPRLR